MLTAIVLFIVAGLAEIGGGYLVCFGCGNQSRTGTASGAD